MKKIISTLVLLSLLFSVSLAQNSLVFSLNNNYVQNNISIAFQRDIGSHNSIYAGVKVIQKIETAPDNTSPFEHRFYPSDIGGYIGLNLGYKYKFFARDSKLSPYLFNDIQLSYANVITDDFVILSKTFALENNIGIGLDIQIIKHVSLFVRGGLGLVFVPNSPSVIFAGKIDYSTMLGAGLKFQL